MVTFFGRHPFETDPVEQASPLGTVYFLALLMNTGSLLLGCSVTLLLFDTVRWQPDPGERLGRQIETCM